jgi:hypothetical protein
MAKVKAPSGGKQGGTGGTTKQVAAAVNKAVNNAGLSTKEAKFISDMISKAAQTGKKGISKKERQVIINEAKKQAADKNKGVAQYKTSDVKGYIQDQKYKLSLNSSTTTDTNSYTYTPLPDIVSENKTLIVQIPNRDNLLQLNKSQYDVGAITALVFEKLGAIELTKFTRHDTVDGVNPYYNIISNLSLIKQSFNPSNLISSQRNDDSLYNAFSIKLDTKIPDDEYLKTIGLDNYVYIDNLGNLIIELVNITVDEIIELEIDTNGTIVEIRP